MTFFQLVVAYIYRSSDIQGRSAYSIGNTFWRGWRCVIVVHISSNYSSPIIEIQNGLALNVGIFHTWCPKIIPIALHNIWQV